MAHPPVHGGNNNRVGRQALYVHISTASTLSAVSFRLAGRVFAFAAEDRHVFVVADFADAGGFVVVLDGASATGGTGGRGAVVEQAMEEEAATGLKWDNARLVG